MKKPFYVFVTLITIITASSAYSNEVLCGPKDGGRLEYFTNLDKIRYKAEVEKYPDLLTQNICLSLNIDKAAPIHYAPLFAFYDPDFFSEMIEIASESSNFDINIQVEDADRFSLFSSLVTGAFISNASVETTTTILETLENYGLMPNSVDVYDLMRRNENTVNYDIETWKIFVDYALKTLDFSTTEYKNFPLFAVAVNLNSFDQLVYLTENSDFDPNTYSPAGFPYYAYITGRQNQGDFIRVWEHMKSLGADDELTMGKNKAPFLWNAIYEFVSPYIDKNNRLDVNYKEFLIQLLREGTPLADTRLLYSEPRGLVSANLDEPDLIEEFLIATETIGTKYPNGSDLLFAACERSTSPAVFELILSLGYDVNYDYGNGYTCLHALVTYNPKVMDVIEIIVNAGADINALVTQPQGISQSSVVQMAVANQNQSFEIFEYLISSGATLNKQAAHQTHPVIYALAFAKDARIIEQIIKLGYELEPTAQYGIYSPVNTAVTNKNLQVLNILLRSGASTNLLAETDNSFNEKIGPLHETAELRNPQKAIKVLLEYGAPIDLLDTKNRTPLIYHIEKANENGALLLIENGANIKLRNKEGLDAVLLASEAGMYKVLQELIKNDIDLNVRSQNGQTAAMMFCSNEKNKRNRQSKKILSMIFASNANIATRNSKGLDALSICLSAGNLTASKMLIEFGAPLTNRYENGRSILQQALDKMLEQKLDLQSMRDVLSLLFQQKIDVNTQDDYGNTILHDAVANDLVAIIPDLIKYGALGNIKNSNNQTAYDIAEKQGLSNQDLVWELNDLRFQ